MTIINLPPLPDGFSYTGEWRRPLPLEYFIHLTGDLEVASVDPPTGYFHIVRGPASLKVDYLSKRLREQNARTWNHPELKDAYVNEMLASIDAAMRDG